MSTACSFRVFKRYLLDLALSIPEICLKVGFSNLAYFTRMFRQLEHMTPTDYRVLYLGQAGERVKS